MKNLQYLILALLMSFSSLKGAEEGLPADFLKIMNQPKYSHANWGLYVIDIRTGKVLFDHNANKLFSPASVSKLLSTEALLYTFGDDYRFKTPVYATGKIQNGKLEGNLVLVAQGDLTLGGRQSNPDEIAFTKMDHIVANQVPGVILTKEDPLNGIKALAKQVSEKGIKEITGDVLIDDTLFDTTVERGMTISPIIINENLIDVVLNPSSEGREAILTWRPEVPGYTVENQVKTVASDGELAIEVTADKTGQKIVVKGTIPADQHDIVRTFSIQDPKAFARTAFIAALEKEGIKVNKNGSNELPKSYNNLQEVAQWTSPPLTEYVKLILKVSHNLGADLVPLLLASHQGKRTFDEGMRLIGDFAMNEVKFSPDVFVFVDAAGGNENRLTPQAVVQLLTYVHRQAPERFKKYRDALPILGVDGSLEDFAKNTEGVGKVWAKPGTGMAMNSATGNMFLIAQSLGGYIEGKDGRLLAYMLVVNNGSITKVDDVFGVFEDVSQLSNAIYLHSQ